MSRVPRLFHRVEDIAELDDMPAPTAVADIDTRARHIVNRAMANGDVLGQVDIHAGSLLFHAPGEVNQAIIDQSIRRVVLRAWTRGAIEVFELIHLAVVEQRVARCLRVSDKADATRSSFGNMAATNGDSAVVTVYEK